MKKWIWLLLPLLMIPAAWLTLSSDFVYFIIWWLCLSFIGLLAWPLSMRLFQGGDHGYLLAKPLGLGLGAFLLWTFSYLRVLPFQRWSVSLVLCALGLFAWLYRDGWRLVFKSWSDPRTPRRVACSELLFAAGLLFWTFARGLKPELDSLEKFMDLGFMNSIWRAEYLPALDMWLAGGKINYYYFGQYVYTFVAKLVSIRPEISYNLGLASTMAFTFSLAYAVTSRLLQFARKHESHLPKAAPAVGGLIGAALVTFAGNSHAFFYDPGSPGHVILKWLNSVGLVGGDIGQSFWFADSTRFIGYNPDTVDKTIHEFPYYSFLVADLHAHVINLAFVLLCLAVFFTLANQTSLLESAINCRSSQEKNRISDDRSWHRAEMMQLRLRFRATIMNGPLLLIGILLAIFMMGNFWDFAIYLVVAGMILLYINCRGYGKLARLRGLPIFILQCILLLIPFLLISNPILAVLGFAAALLINHYLTLVSGDALTLTGAQVSWLFFLSNLLTLPFNLSFEPISKSISLAVNHTPIWQLLILWGFHILAGLLLILFLLIRHQAANRLRPVFPPVIEDRAAAAASGSWLARLIKSLNPADILAIILLICGVGLILAPEIFYVVDIYSGDYKRANTMFKFTYQAFVLLSLVWAYAVTRIAMTAFRFISFRGFGSHPSTMHRHRTDKPIWPQRIIGSILIVTLIIPGWYPLIATRQWLGDFSLDRYQGLDGLQVLATKDSAQIDGQVAGELTADYSAIQWLNSHVSGQPVILEAAGESYTDYCRISAFTGLPTVFGWETHEWLWRTSKKTPDAYGSVVVPRQEDVRLMYATTDQVTRQDLFKKYQVAYVVIGDLERQKYSETLDDGTMHSLVQEDLLLEMGKIVFQEQSLYIIQINS